MISGCVVVICILILELNRGWVINLVVVVEIDMLVCEYCVWFRLGCGVVSVGIIVFFCEVYIVFLSFDNVIEYKICIVVDEV